MHAGKCKFFLREATWCGKVVSANGIAHCPSRVAGLRAMSAPRTAADLQQWICALNWMRSSIPEYNRLVAPLTALLEDAMRTAKSRKKTKLERVALVDQGWSSEHDECVANCKDALARMVPLAHPRADMEICVYTDASNDFWGAVATQIPKDDVGKPADEQRHEPLAFLSGTFKGASSRWPIVEKEAYAVVETCRRLEYLLLRPEGFRLFTDHRNLVYILHPDKSDTSMAKYQVDKLQRWAMSMAAYRYTIEHVTGDANV